MNSTRSQSCRWFEELIKNSSLFQTQYHLRGSIGAISSGILSRASFILWIRVRLQKFLQAHLQIFSYYLAQKSFWYHLITMKRNRSHSSIFGTESHMRAFVLMTTNPRDFRNLRRSWGLIAGSFCILNDFQFSETHKGIEVLNRCLFQTHLDDLRYVLHGFINGLTPGMTSL